MKPAALGLTCKDAMLVFAQTQTLELQKKVDSLELDIYHLKLPTFKSCMEEFNQRNSRCFCDSCIIGGRADENDSEHALWHFEHDRERCCFTPEWETYLARIGATVNPPSKWPGQVSKYGFQFADTPSAVYTIGRKRDWVFAGWGRPLSSMDSPRKKVWETIIRDCLTDESDGTFSRVSEEDFADSADGLQSATLAVEA